MRWAQHKRRQRLESAYYDDTPPAGAMHATVSMAITDPYHLALIALSVLVAPVLGAWCAALPYRLPARWGWEPAVTPTPPAARWAGAGLMAAGLACAAWRWGLSMTTLAAMVLWFMLVLASAIDARLMLLPDALTLGAMWLGLLINSMDWFAPLPEAVWGAALGYATLWLVAYAFARWRGQQGMGHGDFKLAAAAGAWLGATQIPWLLLLASVMGSAWGLWRATRGHAASQPFAFGPFLALATFVLLVFGHQ